jgi:multidrug efflux pump subunit AcrB
MWIVQLALRRPYTFVVLALLILVFGPVMIQRTPTDIFPNINIPVVAVTFQYTGLNPEEIEGRITTPYEKFLTSLVDNIEHLESTSYNGECVIKIFLQPNASLDTANAQITAVSQQILRVLPPGTLPPEIINFSASTVPVLQIGVSGKGLDEQQLNDLSNNFVRPTLITVPGAVVPLPYGGKQAQITVAMNLPTMQSKGVSPSDLVAAMNAQNVIGPIGTAKIGMKEYDIRSNAAPHTIDELGNLPIKQVDGATIYIRDVATVSNGSAFQTNIVRRDGRRGVLMTILKSGSASTINVVKGIRDLLPRVAQTVPPEMQMSPIGDQSVFVRAAVSGVVREALIAGCLTAFMVLTFLGSWRSTLIIATSIPLSILASIIAFSALGETINMMTLGGLALAVGILVDDATVEVENINRNRELDPTKNMDDVVLHSAAEIATPAFVSTLSICIVFAPMFLLTGVARYLFIPLAEAVVFALLSSYFFSRTVVPTMAKYLLRNETHASLGKGARNPLVSLQNAFERGFGRMRDLYQIVLTRMVLRRQVFIVIFLLACLSASLLIPFLGQDFFPSTDSGAFILHVRGSTGDRIEETARLADLVERSIRRSIPPAELNNILDNIGLPYSNTNIMHMTSGAFGSTDGDITVTLNERHHPTAGYIRELRAQLPREFPGVTFYFLPADMTTQVVNLGLPSPIDVQLESNDVEASTRVADELLPQLKQVPGLTDIRIQEPLDYPTLNIAIDRTKALQGGFTTRDVADSMLNSLSGSYQVSPMYFLNWKNGVSYSFVAQTQQYGESSIQDIQNIPITSPTAAHRATPELLGDLSSIYRDREMAVISHFNVRRVIDIYGAVQDRDLGAVSRDVQKIVDARSRHLPRGMFASVKGQTATMRSSYVNLLEGLCVAILLVYALIVVNFQSWLDPFVIIMALPAALAGIVLMLFLTHTTLSVPALMGAIMCMGVATSNSILVIQFAKERLAEHGDPIIAAIEAGVTRFRPVCMTALAMIIGMVPMALGVESGGEQNAPLGRAVIGGLLCATVATLAFVPSVFAFLHDYMSRRTEGHQPSLRDTQSA